jgi:ABC-2 type transport system permease protein
MAAALLIAGKDLRLRIRDRSALILGFLAPFGIAYVFSLILGPVTQGSFRPEFGLVDLDRGSVSASFAGVLERLDDDRVVAMTSGLDLPSARRAVEDGDLAAAFVVPSGFTEAVTTGKQARIEVIGGVDDPTSVQIARSVAEEFTGELTSARLSVAMVQAASGGRLSPAQLQTLSAAAAGAADPVAIGAVQAARKQLDAKTYYVAGMAVFFVFFIAQFGVTGLLDERRDGTMARLMAAPIGRWAIVAGKAITSVVLGVVSLTVLVVASTLLIGAEWGDPAAAGLLVLAVSLAAAGIMAMVAGLTDSSEAANNIQSIVAVALGMIGGSFFSLAEGSGFLSWVSLATPHQWFLRGLAESAGGGGPADVLPHVAAILLFAAVTGVAGLLLLRRKVAR